MFDKWWVRWQGFFITMITNVKMITVMMMNTMMTTVWTMITLGDGASSLCAPLTRSPLGPLSLEKDWIIAAHPKLANSQPGHASDELCAQNATQLVFNSKKFKIHCKYPWKWNQPVLSVLMATGVVLFHNPSHTSPNCPWPSFLMNLRLVLSIKKNII